MKLIGINTSLENILWSGLTVIIWVDDRAFEVYTIQQIKQYVVYSETTEQDYFELETINHVISLIRDITMVSSDSWEIEIIS